MGREASAAVLSQCASELSGVLDGYAQWLKPEYDASGALVHKGYKVAVSNGTNPADSRITAAVSLRFLEYANYVDFTVSTADAGASI